MTVLSRLYQDMSTQLQNPSDVAKPQSSRLPKRHRSGFFHLGYILAGGLAYCANSLPSLGGFQPCLCLAEFCVRPEKRWNFHQLVPGKAEQALDQHEL